jgi:hypothetical protein
MLKNDSGIFQEKCKPEVWTNGPVSESDRPDGSDQWWAYGYWCGDLLCLIPLEGDVPEERRSLWLAPICHSEEDAMRIFFLVNSLLNAMDGK